MALQLVTPPATEPVTLTQAKTHCKVDASADDDLITALIVAARQVAEHETGRALITQTWRKTLDAFGEAVRLDRPKVLAITSVKYYDLDEAQQTLSAESYFLDNESEPGWVLPAQGYEWPSIIDRANAVEVIYMAGYGASASDVPQAIKQWMLLHIGSWYDNRGALGGKEGAMLPYVDGLLDPFRVMRA